eukprot:g7233.t1
MRGGGASASRGAAGLRLQLEDDAEQADTEENEFLATRTRETDFDPAVGVPTHLKLAAGVRAAAFLNNIPPHPQLEDCSPHFLFDVDPYPSDVGHLRIIFRVRKGRGTTPGLVVNPQFCRGARLRSAAEAVAELEELERMTLELAALDLCADDAGMQPPAILLDGDDSRRRHSRCRGRRGRPRREEEQGGGRGSNENTSGSEDTESVVTETDPAAPADARRRQKQRKKLMIVYNSENFGGFVLDLEQKRLSKFPGLRPEEIRALRRALWNSCCGKRKRRDTTGGSATGSAPGAVNQSAGQQTQPMGHHRGEEGRAGSICSSSCCAARAVCGKLTQWYQGQVPERCKDRFKALAEELIDDKLEEERERILSAGGAGQTQVQLEQMQLKKKTASTKLATELARLYFTRGRTARAAQHVVAVISFPVCATCSSHENSVREEDGNVGNRLGLDILGWICGLLVSAPVACSSGAGW